MGRDKISDHRDFLKDSLRRMIDFRLTDQHRGVDPPSVQKCVRPGQQMIALPGIQEWGHIYGTDVLDAIQQRQSHRCFTEEPLSLTEVSFLLWATQGVKEELAPGTALRTVPSAGCRHPFESYLLVSDVEGLAAGVYRYLPLEHAVVPEREEGSLQEKLMAATLGQAFIATAPLTFVWTVIPYRSEWRYTVAAHRVILMDVGHVCQNLYLACEAVGCGTCAIAAYHQELLDQLLDVDGENEFSIYLAPVGKL